jgi:hypothetical protein
LLCVVLAITNEGFRHQLILATTRQPQRVTELYFAEPTKIPPGAEPGEHVPVNFIIRNLEAVDTDYQYQVTFTSAEGQVTPLAEAKVHLANGQAYQVKETIVIPEGTSRGEVRVQLVDKKQSIHFWLERK